MNSWPKSLLLVALGAGLTALSSPAAFAADVAKAIAVITPTQGSKVSGKVTFTKEAGGVHITAEITGLEEGTHGFHIHEFGDISGPDGMTTGGHFNPHGKKHGAPDAAEHHAGDFGNLQADKAGNARIDLVMKDLAFEGPNGILGHAVVVHAKADDLKTQPSGDAGGRIAVGVIGIAKP